MHAIAGQGFVYPNEIHVAWSVMIALYPYITGLVAGAFIVSSLYHVFGDKDLKPVGNMALVAALCFIMFCMTPRLFHLGQPFRCFNIMFTPNLMSAMSIFGYICFFYIGILLVEIWLVFREDIVKRSQEGFVVKRWFYALLALGVTEMTDESRALDKKVIGVLAAVGIPSACILHGYVGFIFGSIKANPWWSTPLMPIIFLLSAMVSGIALGVHLGVGEAGREVRRESPGLVLPGAEPRALEELDRQVAPGVGAGRVPDGGKAMADRDPAELEKRIQNLTEKRLATYKTAIAWTEKEAGVAWEERQARFVCDVALAPSDGRLFGTHGECPGYIALKPRGDQGFGYDPVLLAAGV